MIVSGGIFDLEQKKEQIVKLSQQQEDPNTWSDHALSQKIGKEKKILETIVEQSDLLISQLQDSIAGLQPGNAILDVVATTTSRKGESNGGSVVHTIFTRTYY